MTPRARSARRIAVTLAAAIVAAGAGLAVSRANADGALPAGGSAGSAASARAASAARRARRPRRSAARHSRPAAARRTRPARPPEPAAAWPITGTTGANCGLSFRSRPADRGGWSIECRVCRLSADKLDDRRSPDGLTVRSRPRSALDLGRRVSPCVIAAIFSSVDFVGCRPTNSTLGDGRPGSRVCRERRSAVSLRRAHSDAPSAASVDFVGRGTTKSTIGGLASRGAVHELGARLVGDDLGGDWSSVEFVPSRGTNSTIGGAVPTRRSAVARSGVPRRAVRRRLRDPVRRAPETAARFVPERPRGPRL